MLKGDDRRGLLQRLAEMLHPGPDSTEELIASLSEAEDRQVINTESRVMLEGVLRLASMRAADVMVPAPRMDVLDINAPYDELLHAVIEAGHSRFPVFDGQTENIIGILHAKDLLKLQRAPELSVRALLRASVFIPESKGLNDLLRDFRENRNHLAIVIDEFGRVAGLITIEDVLEEIVGEIEDEFDRNEDRGDIFALADGSWRVGGDTPIERVNEHFRMSLSVEDVDTIGGLVAQQMGYVPKRGQMHLLQDHVFEVLLSRAGAVRWFKVRRNAAAT
jgi:magnesium and cobalt transporter